MGGGDWESALRQLTRKPPSEGAKTLVLDAMRGDAGDRAAALVMASAADATIQGAIAYALGLKQPEQFSIFYNEGLFTTLDRRIAAASTLKLIGPVASKNARIIKGVRNVFAHAMADVSFADDPIVKACGRIKLTSANQFFVDQAGNKKTRYIFGYACQEIYSGILGRIGMGLMGISAPQAREVLPDLPILP
ncbi:MAG: hypothetical protein NVS3B5_01680 [Sphingomicrobium sp.]